MRKQFNINNEIISNALNKLGQNVEREIPKFPQKLPQAAVEQVRQERFIPINPDVSLSSPKPIKEEGLSMTLPQAARKTKELTHQQKLKKVDSVLSKEMNQLKKDLKGAKYLSSSDVHNKLKDHYNRRKVEVAKELGYGEDFHDYFEHENTPSSQSIALPELAAQQNIQVEENIKSQNSTSKGVSLAEMRANMNKQKEELERLRYTYTDEDFKGFRNAHRKDQARKGRYLSDEDLDKEVELYKQFKSEKPRTRYSYYWF